jgi:hypothetical protein
MPAKTKTETPEKKPPVRPHRLLMATEPKRLALWRAAAKRHNVSLATWVRWACDAVVDHEDGDTRSLLLRLKSPPTGFIRDDGVQL